MSSYPCTDPGFCSSPCSSEPAVLLFFSRKGNCRVDSREGALLTPSLDVHHLKSWRASPKPEPTSWGTQVVVAPWAAEGPGSSFQCRVFGWMTGAASSSLLGENQSRLMMSVMVWPHSWARSKGRIEPALHVQPSTGLASVTRHIDVGLSAPPGMEGTFHTLTP